VFINDDRLKKEEISIEQGGFDGDKKNMKLRSKRG